MTENKFDHLGLTVNNTEITLSWFGKHFGFEVVRRFDKPQLELRGATIKLNDVSIELLEPYKPLNKQINTAIKSIHLKDLLNDPGLPHYAINVRDVSVAHKNITEENPFCATEIFDSRFFFCTNPDGTLIEVRQI